MSDFTELLDRWDKLNNAIERVQCAIPEQMTDAAFYLGIQRRAFGEYIQKFAMTPDFRNGLNQSFNNTDMLWSKLSALANGNAENPEAWPDEDIIGQELGSYYRAHKNLKLLYKDVR